MRPCGLSNYARFYNLWSHAVAPCCQTIGSLRQEKLCSATFRWLGYEEPGPRSWYSRSPFRWVMKPLSEIKTNLTSGKKLERPIGTSQSCYNIGRRLRLGPGIVHNGRCPRLSFLRGEWCMWAMFTPPTVLGSPAQIQTHRHWAPQANSLPNEQARPVAPSYATGMVL